MLVAKLIALALAAAPASFPIPAEKGQQLADPNAKVFKVPHQLSYVERFYREQFKGDAAITFLRGHDERGETLTLRNARKGDTWTKAVIHSADGLSEIAVTPVLVIDQAAQVNGTKPAIVMFVVPRSGQVDRQLQQIDADHAPEH
jgi:hypothetical protein